MKTRPYRKPLPPAPAPAERMARKLEERQKAKEQRLAKKEVTRYAGLEYDYSLIEAEHREGVQAAASEIHKRLHRTIEDMIEIGMRLMSVKEVLPHGQFVEWIEKEFGYRYRAAAEDMNVARRFAGKSAFYAHLTLSTMRLLAAPSLPDEAVERAVELAKAQGEPLQVSQAKQVIRNYRPPKRLPAHIAPAASQQAQRSGGYAEPEPATISAEYTVVAPALSFADWLALMPTDLSLREHIAILELAKGSATRLKNLRPALYNVASNVMIPLSQLIHAVEKELKK